MSKKGPLSTKSYVFALDIIKLYKGLIKDKKEFVLSKQLLRSDTSIGAQIREAEHAQSNPDFLHKINIALKEANECAYLIDLLYDSKYISELEHKKALSLCNELIRMLVATVKTLKSKRQS